MTNLKNVEWQMFRKKSRFIKWVLLCQLIVVIYYVFQITNIMMPMKGSDVIGYTGSMLIPTTIVADIVFMGILSWKSESINNSQTWRLIPMSNTKFYLANILSNILSCIVIFAIQLAVYGILIFIQDMRGGFFATLHWRIKDFFGLLASGDAFMNFIYMVLFLFLIVLFISTFVSFINFSSRAVTDFISPKNNQWVRWLIIIILVGIGSYMFVNTSDITMRLTKNLITGRNANLLTGLIDLELLVGTILFGGLDLWLINNYAESKIVNR